MLLSEVKGYKSKNIGSKYRKSLKLLLNREYNTDDGTHIIIISNNDLLKHISSVYKINIERLIIVKEYYKNQITLSIYSLNLNNYRRLGELKISQFPGCCGMCIIHNYHSYAKIKYEDVIKYVIKEAKKEEYSICMVTDVRGDKIIDNRTAGFKDNFEFINKKTGNTVVVASLNLRRYGKNKQK